MVEGGKIDWACHGNDPATVFEEVVDMDNAIKVAYEFYKKHPKETLIVVTADHETGGLGLGTGKYELQLKALAKQKQSQDILSRSITDLRKMRKVINWPEMKEFLAEKMGFWKELPVSWEQEKMLRDAYEESFVNKHVVFEESLYAKTEPPGRCRQEGDEPDCHGRLDQRWPYSRICAGIRSRCRLQAVRG